MNLISHLKSSIFLRNITTLASATIFAQIIALFTAPILYRIYSQEDYGTLGLYIAISTVIGTFSTLQYTRGILLEKEDINAKQIIWLSRFINVGVSIIVFFLILLGKDYISYKLNNPLVTFWLYLIPLSIFFGGQNEIFRMWANRKKNIKF